MKESREDLCGLDQSRTRPVEISRAVEHAAPASRELRDARRLGFGAGGIEPARRYDERVGSRRQDDLPARGH
jgi:hypothetical protein